MRFLVVVTIPPFYLSEFMDLQAASWLVILYYLVALQHFSISGESEKACWLLHFGENCNFYVTNYIIGYGHPALAIF